MSLTILRSYIRGIVPTLIRGPKKSPTSAAKKGKGKSGTETEELNDSEGSHVFNIFAGVPDAELLPDEQYPKWLWTLSDPPKTYSQLSSTFIYGKDIESATEFDYRRFLRQHRKMVIKVNNSRLKKSKNPVESKIRFP